MPSIFPSTGKMGADDTDVDTDFDVGHVTTILDYLLPTLCKLHLILRLDFISLWKPTCSSDIMSMSVTNVGRHLAMVFPDLGAPDDHSAKNRPSIYLPCPYPVPIRYLLGTGYLVV